MSVKASKPPTAIWGSFGFSSFALLAFRSDASAAAVDPLRFGLMFSCNAGLLRPGAAFPLRMLLHSGMSVV